MPCRCFERARHGADPRARPLFEGPGHDVMRSHLLEDTGIVLSIGSYRFNYSQVWLGEGARGRWGKYGTRCGWVGDGARGK